MKILIELTYYRPHTSGLTIYAERLAKSLVKLGHEVTVLTSQFNKLLPKEEVIDGVKIVRAPVLLRISKGVVMPTFGFLATKLTLENDIIHIHLPQFDAAGLALRGFLFRKPTVITYHCDLQLPTGVFNWIVNRIVHFTNYLACFFANKVVTYTQDYADHSALLRIFSDKIEIIDPPVELCEISSQEIDHFNKINNPNDHHPVIGIAARFATEKGIEVLVSAMDSVLRDFPNAEVWFAGPYQHVIGEEKYFDSLISKINELQENNNWKFLGLLGPDQMAGFYPNIDMLVIPSLNSTEAFGLVQIEAMINGKPSIASNLPGVRQPVIRHKMGQVIPVGDAEALANAIIEVWKKGTGDYINISSIKDQYSPNSIASQFEKMFISLLQPSKK